MCEYDLSIAVPKGVIAVFDAPPPNGGCVVQRRFIVAVFDAPKGSCRLQSTDDDGDGRYEHKVDESLSDRMCDEVYHIARDSVRFGTTTRASTMPHRAASRPVVARQSQTSSGPSGSGHTSDLVTPNGALQARVSGKVAAFGRGRFAATALAASLPTIRQTYRRPSGSDHS